MSELIERLTGTSVGEVTYDDFCRVEIALSDYLVPGVMAGNKINLVEGVMRDIAHLRVVVPPIAAECDRVDTLAPPSHLATLKNELQASTSRVQALHLQEAAVGEKIQQKKKELELLEAEHQGIVGQRQEEEGKSTMLADSLATEDRRFKSIKKTSQASAWENMESLSKIWDDVIETLRSLPR